MHLSARLRSGLSGACIVVLVLGLGPAAAQPTAPRSLSATDPNGGQPAGHTRQAALGVPATPIDAQALVAAPQLPVASPSASPLSVGPLLPGPSDDATAPATPNAASATPNATPATPITASATPKATPSPSAQPNVSPSPTPAAPAQDQAANTVDCRKVACVALTFDDGPATTTPRLLAELRKANAPATFFVLGSEVKRHPDIVRQIVADGHEIGNHSWDHPKLTRLSVAQVRSQIKRTDQAVKDAARVQPSLVRPPYGEFNATVRKAAGRPLALWSVDTLDWRFRNPRKVTARAMKGVQPGSIILMHDIRPTTVKAVPGVIAKLRKQGYTLVTVSELLASEKVAPGQSYCEGPSGKKANREK